MTTQKQEAGIQKERLYRQDRFTTQPFADFHPKTFTGLRQANSPRFPYLLERVRLAPVMLQARQGSRAAALGPGDVSAKAHWNGHPLRHGQRMTQ